VTLLRPPARRSQYLLQNCRSPCAGSGNPTNLVPLDAPLGLIGKAMFQAVLGLGATVPDVKPDEQITGSQAIAILHDVLGDIFPAMPS